MLFRVSNIRLKFSKNRQKRKYEAVYYVHTTATLMYTHYIHQLIIRLYAAYYGALYIHDLIFFNFEKNFYSKYSI